jgi:hypothetical protein
MPLDQVMKDKKVTNYVGLSIAQRKGIADRIA